MRLQTCQHCGIRIKSYPSTLRRFCSRPCERAYKRSPAYIWIRFNAFVQKATPDGCWLWTGARQQANYGVFSFSSTAKTVYAHRVAWIMTNGPIPDGLNVLHRCDNPSCVNPAHLFLGTAQDNQDDAIVKGRREYGEAHGRAIVTEDDVRMILSRNTESREILAREFGVSKGTISDIRGRRSWRHI